MTKEVSAIYLGKTGKRRNDCARYTSHDAGLASGLRLYYLFYPRTARIFFMTTIKTKSLLLADTGYKGTGKSRFALGHINKATHKL